MKRLLSLLLGVLPLVSCAYLGDAPLPEPDYERFTHNVTIVSKNATSIVYEYKNLRVDELAIMAAMYCHDQAEKKAYLDKILLYRNNARRATFICKN